MEESFIRVTWPSSLAINILGTEGAFCSLLSDQTRTQGQAWLYISCNFDASAAWTLKFQGILIKKINYSIFHPSTVEIRQHEKQHLINQLLKIFNLPVWYASFLNNDQLVISISVQLVTNNAQYSGNRRHYDASLLQFLSEITNWNANLIQDWLFKKDKNHLSLD